MAAGRWAVPQGTIAGEMTVQTMKGTGAKKPGTTTRAARLRRLRERLELETDPRTRAAIEAQIRAFSTGRA